MRSVKLTFEVETEAGLSMLIEVDSLIADVDDAYSEGRVVSQYIRTFLAGFNEIDEESDLSTN